jgi:hypothetical protein
MTGKGLLQMEIFFVVYVRLHDGMDGLEGFPMS